MSQNFAQKWIDAWEAIPRSPFQPEFKPPERSYEEFLKHKIELSQESGWEIADDEIHPWLKPHQRVAVRWAVKGGCRALFESFGLGKTVQQLEILRIILKRVGGRGLIVCPLGVRGEFKRDAAILGIEVSFVRSIEECGPTGIYLTNYETVREGKLDPAEFTATSLDEGSSLRAFGGNKIFREFMRLFDSVKYKFVATATPSPNDYIELLAYAAYLGIMDVGQAKTRWFKRDSTKADKLTIHPHKAEEWWLWVSSWALFLQRPSDFGFPDEGYSLPPMRVIHHEVKANHEIPIADRDGQMRMFRNASLGLSEAAREKRESMDLRVESMAEIVSAFPPSEQFIVWCDLNPEQEAIEKSMSAAGISITSLTGSDSIDYREVELDKWRSKRTMGLVTKPVMYGSGVNLQQCHRAIFIGIGFKFQDFFQAIARVHRFLQTEEVEIHLIYSESERQVLKLLMDKWKRHNEQVAIMTDIIKQYGLSELALAHALSRSMGCERVEVSGEGYQIVNNDCILEARNLADNSLVLILTSVPFSSQFQYSPSYNDFGHSESNAQFFEQMDYLTPELYRALMPGRIAAIHVKDRTVPGGMTGMGFQSAYPFHADCIYHFLKHGFVFLGMKTIVTDVVRENNQTYRMGWSEQCKDATKMGYGMPEYLLVFRKPQSDRTKGYADVRVTKSKKRYSKARWQVDAHGFTRSSGDVPINPKDWAFLTHQKIFGMFHDWGLQNIYDFEYHVKLGESIMEAGRLPVTFMLLQPPSWHPDVWTDITRMITVNALQARKGKQMHLCLAKGSRILTRERGYTPIQEVIVGEHVLTHKGRWRKVLVVGHTGKQRAITVKAQGMTGLTLTPDHKLWMRKGSRVREREGATISIPDWSEAKDSLAGYVNFKLPEESAHPMSADKWWIVGRWLACGHWDARGYPMISCGPNKVRSVLEHLGDMAGGRNDVANVWQIRILADPELRSVLEQCGELAGGKHIPPAAYTLPEPQAAQLLDGYLCGDGFFLEERSRWMASSVSSELILGLSVLAQRVHKAIASVYPGRPDRMGTIQGRIVHCQQEWGISFDEPNGSIRKRYFIENDGAWKKVRSIHDAGEVDTWNMRVEEDESYTAEGCIVKNCPMQFDLADRVITQMSNPGDIVADPFSGLGTVPMRAVALGRKAWGVELNPGYFLDSVGYCEAAARKMAMPTLFDMIGIEDAE